MDEQNILPKNKWAYNREIKLYQQNDNIFYAGNKKLCAKAVVVHFSPNLLDAMTDPGYLKPVRRLVEKARGPRVQYTRDLQNHTDKSITEIGYESGYHNPTNFNKFFSALTGTTPSAYRKKIK
ncbi:MAG TPA: helix-turn-helix domain-containing protein [Chitinophagaceae bacterium]